MSKAERKGKFAIVVGGGPAPGLNGVISAATIEATNNGYEVVGLMEGYRWLAQGDTSHVIPLTIDDVSRIHLQGGSILRTARTNPTKSPEQLQKVLNGLDSMGIEFLVSIGGDDTAYTASCITKASNGRLKTAHVPKTIDNDLPLPGGIPTFGYMTARHFGVDIVQSLSEDARTTARWYFVVAMGRTAGHLALGIGKAAGATLTIIPEEFGDRKVTLKEVGDILEGAIIKRLGMDKDFGVAILAEGLASRLDEKELAQYGSVEHDDHGHIRLSEINLGRVCKEMVRKSLASRGIEATIVSKDLGYELRSADPGPYDQEYTRDLGYGAVKYLLKGGIGALITMQGGSLVPIPFDDMIDPATKRTRVRLVDVHSESYEVARNYMIRITPEDLVNPTLMAAMADAGKMSEDQLKARFGYLQGDF
ncbi:MAG: diphosphate--fructose-6-phosphate 1-phosphotransferase [Verrucomicrobia bacterium]|nr:diphosphate--fructose-6-phosphate 1-phosphotransferase [Verrucomicrobiota bacterium]